MKTALENKIEQNPLDESSVEVYASEQIDKLYGNY